SQCDVADGVAREKVDAARLVRRIAFTLRLVDGEHDVAVRVVDRQHAFGAHGADFETVHGARPHFRQRPRTHTVIYRAGFEADDVAGAVDPFPFGTERFVDGPRVNLDRFLRLHEPHD